MFQEFREFVNRGNVVDLALAVIIGAAFAPVISTLVDAVIMPPIGLLVGGIDFGYLGWILGDASQYGSVAEAVEAGAPVIQYGAWLNTLVNFLIVAFVVFLVGRWYNLAKKRWERQQDAQVEEAPKPPREEVLLEEIRDLLREGRTGATTGD